MNFYETGYDALNGCGDKIWRNHRRETVTGNNSAVEFLGEEGSKIEDNFLNSRSCTNVQDLNLMRLYLKHLTSFTNNATIKMNQR